MGYHFIALAANAPGSPPPVLGESQVAFLRSRGLRIVLSTGSIIVFASGETPALPIPNGVVIGHLFSRTGQAATTIAVPTPTTCESFEKQLLSKYWGEYVLIQSDGHGAGLHVLRDPSGGVPCLYSCDGQACFVTSDVTLAQSLGVFEARIDWHYIAQALAYPHLNTARTAIAGLQELLPGCSLQRDHRQRPEVRDSWTPWVFVSEPHRHREVREAAAEVRATVTSVVRAWAAVDRAILVELSGGLDSSIVAMCLRESGAEITCCTMATPVPGADERMYARTVADALGVELQVETLGFGSARFDFDPPVPTARPRMSVLQYVVHDAVHSVARRTGSTSFFSGGGGDTVFGYLPGAVPAADAFRERGLMAGMGAIRDLSALHQCTHWRAGRLTVRKLMRGAKAPCKPETSLLAPSFTAPDVHHPWFDAPPGMLPGDRERVADLAGTQAFRNGAPRGSTHWLRMPLLSQPVMEACLKAPSWMWITGGENRALARRAFADVLPADVLRRRSKGTFMNYFGAIHQRNRGAMRDYLMEGALRSRGLLHGPALETFFETTLPPRDTSFIRIFDLCMIENWIRHQG